LVGDDIELEVIEVGLAISPSDGILAEAFRISSEEDRCLVVNLVS
jgi:hypothetical protein